QSACASCIVVLARICFGSHRVSPLLLLLATCIDFWCVYRNGSQSLHTASGGASVCQSDSPIVLLESRVNSILQVASTSVPFSQCRPQSVAVRWQASGHGAARGGIANDATTTEHHDAPGLGITTERTTIRVSKQHL